MSKNYSKIKATIATVKVGHLEFEGLYAAEIDTFGIAVPQICSVFSFDKNQASRNIKSLLGLDSPFDQWRTSLNSKAVNVLLINDFERLIRKLDRKGDKVTEEITDQLIGLSLTQLFSDAFNIHFEKEQRQLWLKARQEGKIMRRELTDAIADYLAMRQKLVT